MRRLFATMLGFVLALAMPAMALADQIDGKTGWRVEYNTSGRLVDNYTQASWADNINELQPGDIITLTIEMIHSNDTAADWYISNEVLKSFEEADAKGSAYAYTLTYVDPSSKPRVLYQSELVGGTGSEEGLVEATNAMDDYFYLDTLNKGQKGNIKLDVEMDGETEGNDYFDKLARLSMKFAVEPNVTPQSEIKTSTSNKVIETVTKDKTDEKTKTNSKTETVVVPKDTQTIRVVKDDKVVEDIVTVNRENVVTDGNVVTRVVPANRAGLAKTGDETTLFPVYLGIAGLGIVCLALAIRNLHNKDDGKEGGAR